MRLFKILAVAALAALSLQVSAMARIPASSGSESQGGAVTPEKFNSDLSQLSYNKKIFSGKVTSNFSRNDVPDYVKDSDHSDTFIDAKADECVNNRKAELYRVAQGEDVLINDDKTNNRGVFAIDARKQRGKSYYVVITEHPFLWWQYYNGLTGTTLMTNGLCEKVKGDF